MLSFLRHLKYMAAQHPHVCKLAALAVKFLPIFHHFYLENNPAPLLSLLCMALCSRIEPILLHFFNFVVVGIGQNISKLLKHRPCVHLAGMPFERRLNRRTAPLCIHEELTVKKTNNYVAIPTEVFIQYLPGKNLLVN